MVISHSHILTFSHSQVLTFSLSHLLTFSLSHFLTFSSSHILTFSLSHLLTFSLSQVLTFSLSHLLKFSPSHFLLFSLLRSSIGQHIFFGDCFITQDDQPLNNISEFTYIACPEDVLKFGNGIFFHRFGWYPIFSTN
jgi:hypothetical protein